MSEQLPPPPVAAAVTQRAPDVCRTALIIDGAYAHIGARKMSGGRIDYVKLRDELERQAACRFRESWFFDQEPTRKSANQENSAWYTTLKLAPPHGPQFQLKLYGMKKYACHCRRCGHEFSQNVQKGVDNGIATKILSLAYENVCDRFILFAGDGDFYDSLNLIKNVLRKDLWVIGYRNTVSADLQQLAAHVIWMDEIWTSVQAPIALAPGFRPDTPLPSAVAIDRGSQGDRRIRVERDSQVPDDATGQRKAKNQRRRPRSEFGRNEQAPRTHSTSPDINGIQLDGAGQPLFFVDTGRHNESKPTHSSTGTHLNSRPAERSTTPRGVAQRSRRQAKRKREDPPSATVTFELSDMSSEQDEQHPPLAAKAHTNEVINLASDSE